jgi:2-oxoglutarate dehydrogenase E1 component
LDNDLDGNTDIRNMTNQSDVYAEFYGPNAGYVWELYERFLRDPNSVDAKSRAYFEEHAAELERAQAAPATPTVAAQAETSATTPGLGEIVKVVNLANAIREYGHLAAHLDPLGTTPPDDPTLHLDYYELSEEELRRLPAGAVGGPLAQESNSAWEAIQKLREVYSSTTGYDYDHLRNPGERDWLRNVAESKEFRPPNDPIDLVVMLER